MTLQVIGAGFGRTGTASVKVALEKLLGKPCYHMAEVLGNPALVETWMRLANGEPVYDELFSNFGASVDFPACSIYRELAAHYPNAKVLLTVRDPNSWFDSVHETIMSPAFLAYAKDTPYGAFSQHFIWGRFDNRVDDRAHMVQCFEKHIEDVKAAIEPKRLLIYEVKQGWEPLCKFLGLPVPNVPFPHVNSRAETAQLMAMMMSGNAGEGFEDRLSSTAEHFTTQIKSKA